mmetsp:Transcript_70164/g.198912  ORF Transcript_70164/g.198912 Transcript_70164/m.198912 type:complete len:223 (-) Transcript_70164:586-1254(-)
MLSSRDARMAGGGAPVCLLQGTARGVARGVATTFPGDSNRERLTERSRGVSSCLSCGLSSCPWLGKTVSDRADGSALLGVARAAVPIALSRWMLSGRDARSCCQPATGGTCGAPPRGMGGTMGHASPAMRRPAEDCRMAIGVATLQGPIRGVVAPTVCTSGAETFGKSTAAFAAFVSFVSFEQGLARGVLSGAVIRGVLGREVPGTPTRDTSWARLPKESCL